ncbi:MAG: ATP-binding cassette domain-containing protein [Candidatus Heimdallarchaeota archaeon]|nr:ATP-binding cassette domain-containing protein [Candidatus Heimdallarchaeota archaeon]
MLEIQDFSVKYVNSSFLALDSINFHTKKGELVIIAGPSGSGKSTLAHSIMRLIPAFVKATIKGSILLYGKELLEINRKELVQLLGYVPQYPSDFTTSLLVEEEIAFPLENLRFPPPTIPQRVNEVLNMLDISSLQKRLITELSSGEIQRVELATAIAPSPSLLILDEPMARIDPRAEIQLANNLRKLADNGHTCLVFEHRLDYLLNVADRLIILEEGKVIGDGNPSNLVHQLKQVDLPELTQISVPTKSPILSISEAKEILKEQISKRVKGTDTPDFSAPTTISTSKVSLFSLQNVDFRYPQSNNFVFKNLNYAIPENKIIGLIGDNGSGKTTFFKLLSGILKPTKGKILYKDEKVKRMRSVRNDLLFVPENAKLFLVGPTPEKDLTKAVGALPKARALFKEYNLTDLSKKKLYHLSEGQRRLIALFIAFHCQQEIILLDEPTIGLDQKGRALLLALIHKGKKEGKTTLIASNDHRIFTFMDELVVLHEKNIILQGDKRRVLYELENKTSIYPNQIVRLITELEAEIEHSLPHFLTVEELNHYLSAG